MVTTYRGLRFKYGYFQVVARIPAGDGLWPALWLAAADGAWPPEIDMIEHWGAGTLSSAFFHPVGARQVRRNMPANLSIGWHTFALSWTWAHLTWFVDGKKILSLSQQIPRQKMYFVANLAEYRKPTSAAYCNGQLDIRSVKYWPN